MRSCSMLARRPAIIDRTLLGVYVAVLGGRLPRGALRLHRANANPILPFLRNGRAVLEHLVSDVPTAQPPLIHDSLGLHTVIAEVSSSRSALALQWHERANLAVLLNTLLWPEWSRHSSLCFAKWPHDSASGTCISDATGAASVGASSSGTDSTISTMAATWTRVAAWTATGMQTRTQWPDDLCFDGGLDDDLSSDTGDLSFLEEALVLRVDGFDGLVFLNACTEALRDETAVVAAPLPAAASAACPPWSLSTVCSLATTRLQLVNEVIDTLGAVGVASWHYILPERANAMWEGLDVHPAALNAAHTSLKFLVSCPDAASPGGALPRVPSTASLPRGEITHTKIRDIQSGTSAPNHISRGPQRSGASDERGGATAKTVYKYVELVWRKCLRYVSRDLASCRRNRCISWPC
ncbi:hypothetical protein GQ600_7147 [Phytophthora cactorum]|nr:hypothetical protein GQ600_7147 [Phytophthora cactorum]